MRLEPDDALDVLLSGNKRFVQGTPTHPNQDAGHRTSVADSQTPFAVVFGCSDSRLAAEIIFDQGLGDLFVVRTAGHTSGPEVLGSIEYAIEVLDVPLVVVLGHSSCGAVKVALDTLRHDGGSRDLPSSNLRAVVDAVAPSVNVATSQGIHDIDAIVDMHTARTANDLVAHSSLLAGGVAQQRLQVVGMSYQLGAGEVHIVT